MSCDVVILEIGENRRKLLRNISGIKYKILLSTKFKNNIPYELNTCEIRFLELSTFQEIIRKSKVNSVLKTFHEIIPKFTYERSERTSILLSRSFFFLSNLSFIQQCSGSTASYRIGNEALAHHEPSPLVLLLFHQIPEGSQGRRRDGQRGKGVRKRGREDGETGWESGGSGQGLLSFEQPEFLRLFFTVTPAVPEPLIANVTHNVVSLRTSCVEHEDRPCIRIRWAGWLVMLPSYQATLAKKRKTKEERAAKTGKGGAEKSDRVIGLTTRPRKGIYSWRRTQTRVYCLSKLFFRSQWTCRLCEISRGLSLKYSIKRPDEIYTRPASNDRPLESGVSCHVFHICSKKLEFRSFRLIVHISRANRLYVDGLCTMICFSYASFLDLFLRIF